MPEENEDQESTQDESEEEEKSESQTDKSKLPESKQKSEEKSSEDSESFSAEYVKKLRTEAAENRKRAKAAEDKLKSIESEKLSESEKKELRIKELESQVNSLALKARTSELMAFAATMGAAHPEAVAKLADPEIEDSKEAVESVKKLYPALFKSERSGSDRQNGSADGGAGGRGVHSKPDMNAFIRRAAGRE